MKFSDKTYNILKYVGLIAIPAFATFLSIIFELWHLPYGPQIVGTVTACGTLLGALLKVSTDNYYKEGDTE